MSILIHQLGWSNAVAGQWSEARSWEEGGRRYPQGNAGICTPIVTYRCATGTPGPCGFAYLKGHFIPHQFSNNMCAGQAGVVATGRGPSGGSGNENSGYGTGGDRVWPPGAFYWMNSMNASVTGAYDLRRFGANLEATGQGTHMHRSHSHGLKHFNASFVHPNHFRFDGVDDFLGETSTGYGLQTNQGQFQLNASEPFTISQWCRTDWTHYLFDMYENISGNIERCTAILTVHDAEQGFGSGGPPVTPREESSVTVKVYSDTNDVDDSVKAPFCLTYGCCGGDDFGRVTGAGLTGPNCRESLAPLPPDRWMFITVTHDGSGNYKVYIHGLTPYRGGIGGIMNNGWTMGNSGYPPGDGAGPTGIWGPTGNYETVHALGVCEAMTDAACSGGEGWGICNGRFRIGESDGSYSSGGTRLGIVLMYQLELHDWEIYQNFLATHLERSDRVYGVALYSGAGYSGGPGTQWSSGAATGGWTGGTGPAGDDGSGTGSLGAPGAFFHHRVTGGIDNES